MRKFLGVCLILAVLSMPSCFGAVGGSVVRLDNSDIEKPEIELQDNTKKLNNSLLIDNSEDLSKLIDEQKEHDLKDL